jgi:Hsp20/alpha crystallin family
VDDRGPYHRELTLPQGVDGARANATYGNGVLVLALPKAEPGRRGRDTELRLEGLAATRGAHVGHTGCDRHETTTAEHLQRQGETARRAGTGNRPCSSPP